MSTGKVKAALLLVAFSSIQVEMVRFVFFAGLCCLAGRRRRRIVILRSIRLFVCCSRIR